MTGKDSARFDNLRRQAEKLVQESTGEVNSKYATSLSLNLDEAIHELEVYQMELEMQHAELQDTQSHLEQNRQEYIDLFDFAPIGYLVTDNKGLILNVNLTLASMFGLDRLEIEGKPFAKFISEPFIDIYYLSRQNVFASETAQTCEISLQLPDNRGFYARLDSTLIKGTEYCQVALTDITKQKKAEQATTIALERERELNRLKSQLLDMITHEFRTPLSIILSSVDTVERYNDRLSDKDKAQRYQKIRDYVWHMTRMVNEVTSAYRMETDSLKVKPVEFDCKKMLSCLLTDLEIVNSRRVNFVVAETKAKDFMIEFDDMLLRQIMMNIVSNAVKFSNDTVKIRLEMLPDTFIVTVADTGAGIPHEDQSYIFDTFFRSENIQTMPGTGIGLSIVKNLVERCRGKIELKSVPGKGTTFTLNFPRILLVS